MTLALALDRVRRMHQETITLSALKELLRLRRGERRLPFSMALALAVDRVRRTNQESIAPSALKELTTQSGVMTKMLKPPRMNRPNVRFTGMFVNTVT